MKLLSLLTCTALFNAIQVNAQLTVGPAAGFRITSYTTSSPDGTKIPKNGEKNLPDLQAGVMADMPVTNRLHLQSGLLFTTNRYKKEGLTPENQVVSVYYNIRSLELPLSVTINTNTRKHGHFFLGAGGFVASNVSGKRIKRNELVAVPSPGSYRGVLLVRVPVSEQDLKFGPDTPAAYRRIGLGVGCNAGYQFRNGMFVRAHFQQGLRSQLLPQVSNYKTTSYNFGLMAGILLGHNRRQDKSPDKGDR
ncbi:MAG: PorT family protein [Taibaiella sp.]|nr:PorT family protein [Taibaiella sp.]